MQIEKVNNVFFIGIGGIGMSGLAQWFHKSGYCVAGYDKTETDITSHLQNMGIDIVFDESVDAIPAEFKQSKDNTLVVYTPAIPQSHIGFNYFVDQGYEVIKRAKALGMLVNNKVGLAVAGTHGKTSVSTTLATILNNSSKGCSAFVGGVSKNIGTNVLINPDAEAVVVEADEFDRSFLTLFPQIAAITSMDADHLDIYGQETELHESFKEFVSQIKPGGTVIVKKTLPISDKENKEINFCTYSLNEVADYYAKNIRIQNGKYSFDVVHPNGIIEDIILGVPGLYNVENAVAAVSVALTYGVDESEVKQALAKYEGVKRRFDIVLTSGNNVLVDDYAHHPKEIESCYNSLRDLYPGKTIAVIFQPHLYSRTKDFADGFAQSLDSFDNVVLTDLYPARELPIEGISSYTILNLMDSGNKQFIPYSELESGVAKIDSDIVVTMGAGDIDKKVEPIRKALAKKWGVVL